MAKLHFIHSAMNSGKTGALIQAAHNYTERGMLPVIAKPTIDTKAGEELLARTGLRRPVDIMLAPDHSVELALASFLAKQTVVPELIRSPDALFIDEAQFLTYDQVDELVELTIYNNLPVLAFGLRTDFLMKGFPGSTRLLEVADEIRELHTVCWCGKRARCNTRKVDGQYVFEGDQVAIDGDVEYESLCKRHYLEARDIGKVALADA